MVSHGECDNCAYRNIHVDYSAAAYETLPIAYPSYFSDQPDAANIPTVVHWSCYHDVMDQHTKTNAPLYSNVLDMS